MLPLLEEAKEIVTEWTRQQLYRWLGEDALRIRVEPGLTAASGQDCQVLFECPSEFYNSPWKLSKWLQRAENSVHELHIGVDIAIPGAICDRDISPFRHVGVFWQLMNVIYPIQRSI